LLGETLAVVVMDLSRRPTNFSLQTEMRCKDRRLNPQRKDFDSMFSRFRHNARSW